MINGIEVVVMGGDVALGHAAFGGPTLTKTGT